MNEKNLADLVRNISRSVQQTVNAEAFEDIRRTVDSTVREIRDTVYETVDTVKNTAGRPSAPQRPAEPYQQKANSKWMKRTAPGKITGLLLTVLGAILGTPALLALAITLILLAVRGFDLGLTVALLGVGSAACGLLFGSGLRIRRRALRFEAYRQELRGMSFCSLAHLAQVVGKSVRFVVRDVRQMIELKFFPQAHLDVQETCLILDNETYAHYLEAEEHRKLREEEAQRRRQRLQDDPRAAELEALLEDGERVIRQIRAANDAIPGEEISQKLFRLEEITSKIFDHVEQHPEKLPEIRKFLNYYLPITLKLVNAYREFDSQPVQGETILSAKAEICDTLDTINRAFENLLDSLFEDAAMDVSTDISVLETMLAQEGLTARDFKDQANNR